MPISGRKHSISLICPRHIGTLILEYIDSFLEGNLFVTCGSMPTLRNFFKHFAPPLVGSSSLQESPYAYAAEAQRHYAPFGDDGNELQDFGSPKKDGKTGGMVTVDGGVQMLSRTIIARKLSYRPGHLQYSTISGPM